MSAPAPIEVADIAEADRPAWRAYVDAHADATLFHDLRWLDAVNSAYGYRNYRLAAKRGERIVGVLPLTLVASPLLGRSLISVAFAVGGGVLGDDEEARCALGVHALDLGRRLKVNYVELRGGPAPGEDYQAKTGVYAAFAKELPVEPQAILSWLPRSRRAEVRKSLRFEETGESAFRIADSIDEFYRVYAAALRNLGTPVMPKRFVAALKANFGADAEIGLVEHQGEPVAGLFSFWRENRVMPYYIGAGAKAREIRAYDYLYYTLMRRAAERGVRTFDFGRSKIGSTHFDTKTYWGFEPAPVVHHVALVGAKKLPNVNPNNPKFARFVAAWRRLPLPLANALGPIVARNFP